jgi:nitrate/nitrite-specific signal transduction histidine kinase
MDTEHPSEDSVNDAPPVSGEGASESFTEVGGDLPPELESRYKSMQADYTRKTQELSELRREAEAASEFFNALSDEDMRDDALRQLAEYVGPETLAAAAGFEVADEDNLEPDFSEFDESPAADPRVDQLAAEWESYKEAQQEQAILQEIESFTDGEMARLGVEDDAEQRAVLSIAATMDLDREGFPQLEAAKQMLDELYGSRQKEWIESKKAPRQPLQGEQAEEGYDFSNEEERRKRIAALIEANE